MTAKPKSNHIFIFDPAAATAAAWHGPLPAMLGELPLPVDTGHIMLHNATRTNLHRNA